MAGKGRGREVRERPVSPRPTRAAQRCGRARSVLDQVEQALMRHAATGPCLEQLHPASDTIQGGGTGATLGVARRARLGGRAFAFDGRLMTASSTGSLPITQFVPNALGGRGLNGGYGEHHAGRHGRNKPTNIPSRGRGN